jgi:ADP-heptose:LPS heptosyltransferase
MKRILIIKHGALGDVVLATGPFAAIRKHHHGDHITLLTTPSFVDLLGKSGYFDDIWIDTRPKLYSIHSFLGLLTRIRRSHFTRIYDLQTSERTLWYWRFLGKNRPEWVGIAPGCSHQHNTPERTSLHTVERQKQQLAVAGIAPIPAPDVSWLATDISTFSLPERFILIAAGGSSHRPGKRWPASRYGELCEWLVTKGVTPVLIGTTTEAAVLSTIESICPSVINLMGKTGFAEIAEMARGALLAIGNDTGPMHLISTSGCPSLVLFSQLSNPTLCSPRGKDITVLRESRLADLSLATVTEWIGKRL